MTRAALPRLRIWRVSRPGRRVYVGSHEFRAPAVLSISFRLRGLMSGKTARKENVGELLAEVYKGCH
jgi:ribosomal protein S8